jgi:hypothetical protein
MAKMEKIVMSFGIAVPGGNVKVADCKCHSGHGTFGTFGTFGSFGTSDGPLGSFVHSMGCVR